MNFFIKIKDKNIKRLPIILLLLFIVIIVVLALIISANKMMEYVSIKTEIESLKQMHENKMREIDELKHYINTEVDDEYRERMARLLGYCFPDETIYYVE